MSTPHDGWSTGDHDPSETSPELAWSQEASSTDAPVSYPPEAPPEVPADPGDPAEPEPLIWYKRPVVLFGLAAALALAATGGLAYTLTRSGNQTGGNTGVVTTPDKPSPTGPGAPPASMTEVTTVTVTAPDGSTSLSTIPPTNSSTAPATTTQTTTPSPSTTQASTTTTTQPATSTTSPATSSSPPSTAAPRTTAVPPTTAASVAPTGSQ